MKVRVLMATLAITLMLGVQSFANPCDSACVDPCASSCNGYARTGNLFSGLKKLVNGARFNNCDPCDAVVANPCDDLADCNPCDVVCDRPQFGLGGRLRNLFANGCTPCDALTDCTPCDPRLADCTPCGITEDCSPCGDLSCSTPRFRLRNLFNGLGSRHGCNTGCEPCDPRFTDCDPCDPNGFSDCGTSCGPRNCLVDLPRISLSRLFGGLRGGRCIDSCDPCGEIQNCLPCDNACFR